jgi:uncharacterized membrane protein YphA (DoxX/SURF4 family)
MKLVLKSPHLLLAFRVFLGLIFVIAGILKARDSQSFADSIATFQVLPKELINMLAMALPPLEIIVGLMLLVGWQARAAAFSIALLLAVFNLAFIEALLRGLNIDCGCFGAEVPSTWKSLGALGRDLLLLAITCWVYTRLSLATREAQISI